MTALPSPTDAPGAWHLAVVAGLDAGSVDAGPRASRLAELTGPGAVVRLDGVAVQVRLGPPPLPRRTRSGSACAPVVFNRPPRSHPAPRPPMLDVPAAPPLDRPPEAGPGIAMLLGPVVFAAVMAMLFSPLMAVFALTGPVLMLGAWAERRIRARRQQRHADGLRRERLAAFEQEARRHHASELRARRARHPDPVTLRSWADRGGRLWERRAGHDDAFTLSVGVGPLPWSPSPPGQGEPPADVAAVVASIGPLLDAPIVVRLGPGRAVGVVGPPRARAAVVRWLVVQLATVHGPADVTVRTMGDDETASDWAFVDALPHGEPARQSRGTDGDGPLEVVVVVSPPVGDLVDPLAHLLAGDRRRAAIVVADEVDDLPSWCTSVVELLRSGRSDGSDGRAVVREPGTWTVTPSVLATGISLESAERWATSLAGHRDPEGPGSSVGLPDRVRLDEIVVDATPEAILERWAHHRSAPDRMPAPLGVARAEGVADAPVLIDLVADGPHALIGGTTGSGKSELLRTLVLSLALHHGPDALSFLLVDYKGGSAFDACVDLPHTVGVVTDLDPHLGARALTALDAEVRRRERVLREAGVADLTSGAVTSLARLVVVIDEFATLAAELPGFLDALVDVAQRGRSLGVHLVMATQRPHGAINDRIRTNTNLRIALRMLDRADSTDVIDDPVASHVRRDQPGRAFARLGHDELTPFQTALTEPARLRELVGLISDAAAAADLGRPDPPWLPPLPPSVSLDALDPLDPRDHGVPLARADEPDRQRQRTWAWHPDRGNLVIVGMPGSGTTTTLVSIGLVLAGRHRPDRCHLYGVADGSGRLQVLSRLPHVGAVLPADDVRRQARLVRSLIDTLDRRHGGVEPGAPIVVVLIDDLPGLLRRFDTIDGRPVVDDVHRLFRDGPVAGIHLAVTSDRPNGIPAALASRTDQRVVLRLADPFDLTALGLRPRVAQQQPPGRGIVGQGAGTEVQVACSADPSATVSAIARSTHLTLRPRSGGPAPIGDLPSHVAATELPLAHRRGGADRPALVLPLGIGDHDLTPSGLELGVGDHALVIGPPRSGRSTALLLLARSLLDDDNGALGQPAPGVVALVPRPSPLRRWPGVEVVTGTTELLAAVARGGGADTTLVLIDDCELVDDPDGALAALATSCRPGLHLVAAGRADRLRTAYGHWSTALRSSGNGVVLRPDLERDGDLWGLRLPHDPEARRGDGRGFLISDGPVELIQLAQVVPAAQLRAG